jgi:tetratricopeptide (TPR) repeat protein
MHAHLMFVALTCGDETALQRHTFALKPIAEEHNLEIWEFSADVCKALLSASKGDALAIDSYFQADAKLTAINFRLYMPLFRILAGRRALALGLKDHAQRLAAMAEELMQATGETLSLSDLHMLQAALAKADGDTEASENILNTALQVARQQGSRLFELRAAIDLAQLLKDLGRSDEAIALLEPIQASIAEGDCPEEQTKARNLLSEMSA